MSRRDRARRQQSGVPAKKAAPKPQPIVQPLPLGIDPSLLQISVQTHEQFSGPIPHPDVLAKYDIVQAGLADRIVTMAEKEQDFRQRLVDRAVDSSNDRETRGQWMAWSIAIVGLIVTAVVAIAGHGPAAATIGSIDLVGMVGLFLGVQFQKRKQGGS